MARTITALFQNMIALVKKCKLCIYLLYSFRENREKQQSTCIQCFSYHTLGPLPCFCHINHVQTWSPVPNTKEAYYCLFQEKKSLIFVEATEKEKLDLFTFLCLLQKSDTWPTVILRKPCNYLLFCSCYVLKGSQEYS